jgi:hypothetical protein
MNYVYLVQWKDDTGRCAQVFATERGAKAYAAHQRHAWITDMAVRPDAFVDMCFGQSDPAPATITEMLASSNI